MEGSEARQGVREGGRREERIEAEREEGTKEGGRKRERQGEKK